MLIDMAPHLAMLGSSVQSLNPPGNNPNNTSAPINPNLTFASIITNESGQTSQPVNRSLAFQVPVMLTPGEVIAANNNSIPSNRIFGENNNNVEFHIHAVLGPFRNSFLNSNNNNHQSTNSHFGNSPLRHPSQSQSETRPTRSEFTERRRGVNQNNNHIEQQQQPNLHFNRGNNSHPNSIVTTREADQISHDSREQQHLTPSVKEKEEENLNEISFGTRRSLETDVENAFGESNVFGQIFSLRGNEIELQTAQSKPDQPDEDQESRDENLFEKNPDSNSHHTKTQENDEEEDEDERDQDNDRDDDNWDSNATSRRSNCGRNIA
jgi:hypothetical protein